MLYGGMTCFWSMSKLKDDPFTGRCKASRFYLSNNPKWPAGSSAATGLIHNDG